MKDKISSKLLLCIKNMQASMKAFCHVNVLRDEGLYRYPYRLHSGKKNKDKKIVILRYSNMTIGIGQVMRELVADMILLEKKGWTPVVDFEWEHDFIDRQLGKENMWEYCFEQPGGISLEEALESRYVYVAQKDWHYHKMPSIVEQSQKAYYGYYGNLYRKYCRLNTEMKAEIDKIYQDFLQREGKIMGVNIREGFICLKDLDGKIASKHPSHPSLTAVLNMVRAYFEQWNCSYIFLAAQYEDTIELFSKEFGDRLIYIKRYRWKNYEDEEVKRQRIMSKNYMNLNVEAGKRLKYRRISQKISEREITQGYIKEIYGLAGCSSLLAPKCGGTLISLMIKQGCYEHIHIMKDENESPNY